MRTLLIIGFLLAPVLARGDQAADSFGTGFANALQAAIVAGQQKQAPQEAHQQASKPVAHIGHYDVRDNYGRLGGKSFATYTQCYSSIETSQIYTQCVWIGGNND